MYVSLLCCVLDSFHGHLHEPPSDIDLEEVTKEVMGKLRDDWVKLQSYLGIPNDVMYELEHEGSERNKIRALLKQWRNMYNGNRAQLAECLQNADQRLHGAASMGPMAANDFVFERCHFIFYDKNGKVFLNGK